jgi:hypothetical protein
MITREVVRKVDRFDRAQAFTTTPAGEFGWTAKDTSAAGTPTYLCVTDDGGAAKLTIAATSEEEIVTLYQNDVLPFDLAKIQSVGFTVKVAGIDAVTTLVFGVGSAQSDTEDSVAVNAWFRMEGSASTSNLLVETDDGTSDLDDKATGTTLSSTYKKCVLDFTNGLSDIRFFVDGAPVATSTTFTLSGITAGQNVQLFAQLHKASGTGVPSITISNVEIQYATADGA